MSQAAKEETAVNTEANLITEVFKQNFLLEMKLINQAIVKGYCLVALDTEFPGLIYFPKFENKFDKFFSECVHQNSELIRNYNYHTIKLNVNYLKLIQIGITLFNPKTEQKKTWQFNLDFNLHSENYSNESIELLEKSGIDFKNLIANGIELRLLAEYFIISGLFLNNEITWITFHGNYDYAYLLKLLINELLPEKEEDFVNLLKIYFPKFYDLKYLLQNSNFLEGGLNKLSKILQIQRQGYQHQAGSDSLLTIEIFLKLKKNYFNEKRLEQDINKIWGMTEDCDAAHILDYLLKNFTFSNYFYTNYYYKMVNGIKSAQNKDVSSNNGNGINYITEKGRKNKDVDV
jgi:CCR4-NOT transcription complex subunit 7/8